MTTNTSQAAADALTWLSSDKALDLIVRPVDPSADLSAEPGPGPSVASPASPQPTSCESPSSSPTPRHSGSPKAKRSPSPPPSSANR